jgi:hypothetical protein
VEGSSYDAGVEYGTVRYAPGETIVFLASSASGSIERTGYRSGATGSTTSSGSIRYVGRDVGFLALPGYSLLVPIFIPLVMVDHKEPMSILMDQPVMLLLVLTL